MPDGRFEEEAMLETIRWCVRTRQKVLREQVDYQCVASHQVLNKNSFSIEIN